MNTTDPVADMLTRIRNANAAKFKTVDVPASKMKILSSTSQMLIFLPFSPNPPKLKNLIMQDIDFSKYQSKINELKAKTYELKIDGII